MTGNNEQQDRNDYDDADHPVGRAGEQGKVPAREGDTVRPGVQFGPGGEPDESVTDTGQAQSETPLWQQLEEADSFLLETGEDDSVELSLDDVGPDVPQSTSMESLLMASDAAIDADSVPTDDGSPVADSVPTDDGSPVADSVPTDDGAPDADSVSTGGGAPDADSVSTGGGAPDVDSASAGDDAPDVDSASAGDDAPVVQAFDATASDPLEKTWLAADAGESMSDAQADEAMQSAKEALDDAGWNEVSADSLSTDFHVETNAADILFQEVSPGNVSESFDERESFTEEGGRPWAGSELPPDEIGVPVSEDAHLLDDDLDFDGDQELELVSNDEDLEVLTPADKDTATTLDDWAPVASHLTEDVVGEDEESTHSLIDEVDGDVFLLEDCDEEEFAAEELPEYPVEAGWEPMAEGQQEDPWSDDEADQHEADYEQDLYGEAASIEESEAGHQDLGEHEGYHGEDHHADELYYNEQAPTPVAVAPRRSVHVMRMLASLAAAIMVVGAGAVVVLRPEWFGLQFEPSLVERVQLGRPAVTVRVATPVLPAVVVPKADVQVGPEAEAIDDGVAPLENGQAGPPEIVEVLPGAPVVPVPVEPQPVQELTAEEVMALQSGSTDSTAASPAEAPFLPVGQDLLVGQFGAERERTSWSNVQLGSRAFAQLHNGNFFIGMVKSFAEGSLLLRVKDGEVRLARAEVQAVTTLDSVEYAELQKATSGSLRLSNNNRLSGAILDSVVDDNYVLQMRADRIVVPKSVVAQFEQQGGSEALRFGNENGESQWLHELAARHLRAMSVGEQPSEPLPTVGEDPTRKLPLRRTPRFPGAGLPVGSSPNK